MQLSNHLFNHQDNDLNHIHPDTINLRSKQRLSLPNPTEQMLRLPLLRSPSALRHMQRDGYQRRIRGVQQMPHGEYHHNNINHHIHSDAHINLRAI